MTIAAALSFSAMNSRTHLRPLLRCSARSAVRRITVQPTPTIAVHRVTADEAEAAFELIEEYYEAIGVIVRDDRAALEQYLRCPGSPIWIATVNGAPAGCVMFRPLPQMAGAAEVKRMYVRPAYRGMRLAHAMMQAAEQHARDSGLRWLYLDTKDDLHAAIHFYLSRGYERCARYNDNPQATQFFRKLL